MLNTRGGPLIFYTPPQRNHHLRHCYEQHLSPIYKIPVTRELSYAAVLLTETHTLRYTPSVPLAGCLRFSPSMTGARWLEAFKQFVGPQINHEQNSSCLCDIIVSLRLLSIDPTTPCQPHRQAEEPHSWLDLRMPLPWMYFVDVT